MDSPNPINAPYQRTMAKYPPCLDAMLAAWNEPDSSKVRDHLVLALEAHVRFIDPANDITGIDAFEQMVHRVQQQIPGAIYARTSVVDSHHGLYRYHWAIHQEQKLVMPGFDVAEVGQSGKVSQVLGFFGPLERSG